MGVVLEKRKTDKPIVYSFIVWALWAFTYGFQEMEGGGLGKLFDDFHIQYLIIIFLSGILLYYSSSHPKTFVYNRTNTSVGLIFIFAYLFYQSRTFLGIDIVGIIVLLLTLIILYFFFCLRDDIKIRILECFIIVLAFILLFSIIEYLLFLFTGIKIELFTGLQYGDQRNTYTQTLFNFMQDASPYSLLGLSDFYRFQSIAEEPGGVGTTCAFLLFATSGTKKFRFHYVIFWIAGLLSFSLAFYLMAGMHLVFSLTNKKNYIILFIAIAAVILLYVGFQDVFDLLIVERISGGAADNRTTVAAMDSIYNRALENGELWFGYGTYEQATKLSLGSAGIKTSIFQFGIIRVFFLVLAYVIGYMKIFKRAHLDGKVIALVFFVVFWLSFYQRQYIIYFHYILPYFVMPLFLAYKERMNQAQ